MAPRRRITALALCMAPAIAMYIAFLLAPTSTQALQRAEGSVLTIGQLATVPVTQWAENLTQMGGWALAYLPVRFDRRCHRGTRAPLRHAPA